MSQETQNQKEDEERDCDSQEAGPLRLKWWTRVRLVLLNFKIWRASLGKMRWETIAYSWYTDVFHGGAKEYRQREFTLPGIDEPRTIRGIRLVDMTGRMPMTQDWMSLIVDNRIMAEGPLQLWDGNTLAVPWLMRPQERLTIRLLANEPEPQHYRVLLMGTLRREVAPERWYSPLKRWVKRRRVQTFLASWRFRTWLRSWRRPRPPRTR